MNWRKILFDLSTNVQSKVIEVIPQRGKIPYNKFKGLLDNQAQEAIIDTITQQSYVFRM